MKVWHFSEMAYHPAWPELQDSYRVVVPSRLFDPKVGADLYHRYLDEWALCDELGINIMTNEHHATATCADSRTRAVAVATCYSGSPAWRSRSLPSGRGSRTCRRSWSISATLRREAPTSRSSKRMRSRSL